MTCVRTQHFKTIRVIYYRHFFVHIFFKILKLNFKTTQIFFNYKLYLSMINNIINRFFNIQLHG